MLDSKDRGPSAAADTNQQCYDDLQIKIKTGDFNFCNSRFSKPFSAASQAANPIY